MGYTLVVNPGSSSKKYALFEGTREVLRMHFEQTGKGFEVCSVVNASRQLCEDIKEAQFTHAVDAVIAEAKKQKIVVDISDITQVCIRVVAPGTFFQEDKVIDEDYIHRLKKQSDAAPLHIPAQLYEIQTLQACLPHAVLLAASDSAFHKTLYSSARNYAIAEIDAEKGDIYRFGYHGISVASVVRKAPAVFGELPKRMIVCHIGSGVSVTAVKDGKSFDTSMGYAPGSGLVMGTRAGDVDAGALLALMHTQHMRPLDAQMFLQTQGGLRALYGSNDLRNVLEGCARKEEKARKTFDMFAYHIRKAIGSYIATLGGLDALVLTATASERSPYLRSLLLQGLDELGLTIDNEKNDVCVGKTGLISSEESKIQIAVITSDEMGEISRIATRNVEV